MTTVEYKKQKQISIKSGFKLHFHYPNRSKDRKIKINKLMAICCNDFLLFSTSINKLRKFADTYNKLCFS